MVSIQFLGAAGTVTGSKHLLKTPGKNILIDCGLFQGIKSLRLKNWVPLPVDTSEIDLVLLTHAHLDHCGYLPILVKSGYKGKILMTPPTRDLAEIILLDSAKIQEEDAERANRMGFSKHKPAKPLYTIKEAQKAIRLFEVVEDNIWEKISPEIKFRYIKNGHILGSAFIELHCHGKKIVFSGDIGRSNSELMFPPSTISECDFLVMESTYGDRIHKVNSVRTELAEIINETSKQKGNLLIPSFAVGRAQELMHLINEIKKQKLIGNIPIFMDSPMGSKITKLLEKFPTWHKLSPVACREIFEHIRIISDFRETKKTIKDGKLKIVIAASGMLNGGRVLEYLRSYIGDRRNTVLLVGFQAEGTRGRALQNGIHEIKIFGKYYQVKLGVKELSTLSAHADQHEMLKWLKAFTKKKPRKIFLVHGEASAREAFRIKIVDELKVETILPLQNDEMILF
jgi:metallo-beta-lactamase family protein